MNKRIYKQGRWVPTGLLLAAMTSIVSCGGSTVTAVSSSGDGGDGSDNNGNNGNGTVILADPKLDTVQADSAIRDAMLDYYTNDAAGYRNYGDVIAIDDTDFVQESTADSSNASTGSGGETRFSDTNVQEAGVDESDRVKLDGNTMFALERPDSQYNGIVPRPLDVVLEDAAITEFEPPVQTLSAYRLDKNNSSLLSRIKLDHSPSGMYLHKNGGNRDLVLISSGSFDWAYWTRPYGYFNGSTVVSWVNANDANNLTAGRTLTIDGQMISNRKIDNQLILVTRYQPYINGVVEPYNEEVLESNRRLIDSTDVENLKPGYEVVAGGTTTSGDVIGNNQCYKNAKADNSDNSADQAIPYFESPTILSIITIDLNDQSTNIKSTCFVGQSETMYVSRNALYLATTQYQYNIAADSLARPMVDYYPPEITTEVHKFSFSGNGQTEFRGSASVKGHLGWYPERKPFRMSEKDNNLRIVTFDENQTESPVTLNILTEGDGAKLQILSTLPNENRPAPIGKPNENLYASRFIGDKAYLVTFRITDPLYILDVSNPYDPYVAGELELPGYSDYLHPASENLLVGVGKDAVEADTGWGEGRGAFYQGVKLALFDVSDPSAPRVADARIIGKRGTETPALYQHHSFAWLPGDGNRNARMAMPVRLHDERPRGSGASAWSDWTSNKMLKMEVDVQNSVFVDVPDWTFETRQDGHTYSPVGLENDRAVIGSDDGLYVIHNGSLQYGQWNDSEPVSATD